MTNYVDTSAIVQVIGCVFNDSSLLDNTDKYIIKAYDFVEEFHKIVFGSIYNIHLTGSKVTIDAVIDYLANRPKHNAVFEANKGVDYLAEASQLANKDTFNYYYNRLKKFTLLRAYMDNGIDVSGIYDADNILDTKKRQSQEDWLDSHTISDIVQSIDRKVEAIKGEYVEETLGNGYQAGFDIEALIDSFKQAPEVGIAMYGPLINTVTRGARLRKLYLRSGATGQGKTRTMVADACNFACRSIYNEQFGWIKSGSGQPTLFIATEQDKSEIQTMMLAFVSNVSEQHILNGQYQEDEEDRVRQAAKILKDSPLWIEELPDFSLLDVENTMKKYIREYDVRYICFDYIQTSMKILEEITRRSGGVKLREDNILFMLSTRLKDLANEYGIFILTSTQLNGTWRDSDTPDQNLLRGAKSIADKVDCAMILLPVTDDDITKLDPILSTGRFKVPNIKLSVYKNRRGPYTGIYLWCDGNLGTCRVQPQFATTWNHSMISIEDLKIISQDEKEDAPWVIK